MGDPDAQARQAPLVVVSTSLGQDMAYLALRDILTITTALDLDCRIVGGNAVSLLVAAFAVQGVPERDTADADVAAELQVLGSEGLLLALAEAGYQQESGSRLSRPLSEEEAAFYEDAAEVLRKPRTAAVQGFGAVVLRPVVDLMAPSFTGRHEPGTPAGELYVDAFPGVSLALAQPATRVLLEVTLTTGVQFEVSVPLPCPRSALCIKLLAYRDRLAAKDAVDIWRLLAVCREAGVRPEDWRANGTQGDALKVLHAFVRNGRSRFRQCIAEPA